MTPTLRAILALHQASGRTQDAYEQLVDLDPDGAVLVRQAGEQIMMAIGRIVKREAARRTTASDVGGGAP